jgi:hypothetical protein
VQKHQLTNARPWQLYGVALCASTLTDLAWHELTWHELT